jgi:hypothetical protein
MTAVRPGESYDVTKRLGKSVQRLSGRCVAIVLLKCDDDSNEASKRFPLSETGHHVPSPPNGDAGGG